MTANSLLMQFQADVLDVPVVRPAVTETTALGAAYAAGLAVGFWPDLESLRANWRKAAEWLPRHGPRSRERRYPEVEEGGRAQPRVGRRRRRIGRDGGARIARVLAWP